MDASGLLQDSAPPAGRFRPYASTRHRVTRGRYITSNDPRGYIPVYEYPLNGQWIMMDIDDGYILWTGIWKALGNAKADIVKMLESQPELAPQLRRVRGGYLKIQGTWMPYEVALRLARRVAWTIREDLIPLFGPTFPSTCLSPDQPGYGQILGSQHGRRRGRRTAVPLALPATLPPPQTSEFEPSPALESAGQQAQQVRLLRSSALATSNATAQETEAPQLSSPSQIAGPSGIPRTDQHDFGRSTRDTSSSVHYPYPSVSYDRRLSGLAEPQGLRNYALGRGHGHGLSHMPPPPAPSLFNRTGSLVGQASSSNLSVPGPIREHRRQLSGQGLGSRFSPYGTPSGERRRSSSSAASQLSGTSPIDLPPLSDPPSRAQSTSGFGPSLLRQRFTDQDIIGSTRASTSTGTSTSVSTSLGEGIVLPPIHSYDNSATSPIASRERSGSLRSTGSGSGYSLPPISALDEAPSSLSTDSSPGRLDSSVVLKRLTLDDELLGRARQKNFADILEEGSAHSNEGETHVPPTHEQLSARRRSLSAPPLNLEHFPRTRYAWSAAPNIKLSIPANPPQTDARPCSSSSTYIRAPLSYSAEGGSLVDGALSDEYPRQQDSPSDNRPSRFAIQPREFASMGRNLLSPVDVGERTSDSGQNLASHVTSNDGAQEANLPFSLSSPKDRQSGDTETSTSKSSSSTEGANGGCTPRQPMIYLPADSPGSESSPRTSMPSGAHPGSSRSARTHPRTPFHSGTSAQLSADLASYRFGGESQTSSYRQSPVPFNRQREPEHLPMDVDVERTSYFHSSG